MNTKRIARTVILYGLGGLMVFAIGYVSTIDLAQYIVAAETQPSLYHATKARCLDAECRVWFHIGR